MREKGGTLRIEWGVCYVDVDAHRLEGVRGFPIHIHRAEQQLASGVSASAYIYRNYIYIYTKQKAS